MCELESLDVAGFVRAVRATPGSKALVILYRGAPPAGFPSGIGRISRVVRSVLVNDHGLRPDQVEIRIGGTRGAQSAELWVARADRKRRARRRAVYCLG
jgi:hypothetical protein